MPSHVEVLPLVSGEMPKYPESSAGTEQIALPLLTAVFVFGGLSDEIKSFPISRFNSLSWEELYDISFASLNLKRITDRLKEYSEAEEVWVELRGPWFSFQYVDNGRKAEIAINPIDPPLNEWPRLDLRDWANSSFSQSVTSMKSEDEITRDRIDRYCVAASSGWEELFIEFSQLIALGKVELHAHTPSSGSDRKVLARHIWSDLVITDWKKGHGEASDGTKYWLIRAVYVEGSDATSQKYKRSDEKQAQSWLEAEMGKSPKFRAMTKKIAKEQLIKRGHRVSGRAFLIIWRNAIENTSAVAWSEAGPPKKPVQ